MELRAQNDPRIFGKGYIFDNYTPDRRAHFYERYMAEETVNEGWMNESDFEKKKTKLCLKIQSLAK